MYIVELFFVMSGYIAVKYINCEEGFEKYYRRRLIRLLPLMIIGAFIYEILITIYRIVYGDFFGMGGIPDLIGLLVSCLGIQAWGIINNPQINNPTWYVSVLLLMYIVFWGINRIKKKFNCNEKYLYIAMLFLGIIVNTYTINLPLLNEMTSRGYMGFFVGTLLGTYIDNEKSWVWHVFICIYCMMNIIYSFFPYLPWTLDIVAYRYMLTFIFYPSLLVTMIKVFENIEYKLPQGFVRVLQKGISFMADATYTFYIMHLNILLTIFILMKVHNLNIDFTHSTNLVIYILLVVFSSVLIHVCIEIPLTKYLKSKMLDRYKRQTIS